jgi:putative exporter of polyketide antibiotics
VAVATTSGVAVASYLITSLGDANISVFRTLRPLSIFTHYDVQDTLRDGRPSWSLLVLAGIAAVSVVVALVGLDRRDLRNA